MAENRHEGKRDTHAGAPARAVFPIPVLVVTLISTFGAAAAMVGLPATFAWGVALVVAIAGGIYAGVLAGAKPASSGDGRALLLLQYADAPPDRPIQRPRSLPEAWASLYDRVHTLVEESRTGRSALAELERYRRQAELATAAYKEGREPLTDVAELRVGPLRDLLEAAKEGASVGPVVSRIPLGEAELVGVDGEPFPVPWPAGADDPAPIDPRARTELRRGLDEIVRGLEDLTAVVSRAPAVARAEAGMRTPAQLVDAVVHTAADGIEDLAAGLMRANELASVAERVTNRATLLALNAALEATRSGSEAFAAIAEETRRLAEFAREATDTISRLANEIEYKVGETIHAIHQTSEDAKESIAALGAYGADTGPGRAVTAPPPSRAAVEALLTRARELRRGLGTAAAPAPGAAAAPAAAVEAVEAVEADLDPAPGAPASPTSARSRDADDPGPEGDPSEDPDAMAAATFLTIDANIKEDLVENGGAPAETEEAKNFLLLEGLEPGSRIAG